MISLNDRTILDYSISYELTSSIWLQETIAVFHVQIDFHVDVSRCATVTRERNRLTRFVGIKTDSGKRLGRRWE